jgi:Tol biopolymer transport system component
MPGIPFRATSRFCRGRSACLRSEAGPLAEGRRRATISAGVRRSSRGSLSDRRHGIAGQLALVAIAMGLAMLAAAFAPGPAAAQVPRIAYGYEGKSLEGVFVIRVDGLNRHRVTHDLHPASVGGFGPDWSPDGTRIALAGYRSGTSKIFTVRPNGTGQKRITRGASCFGDNSPDWSAHSQHVVFVRDYCDPVKLFSVRRDGTQLTRLTQSGVYDPASGREPRWSPDSRWIAFSRQDNFDRFQIWVMRRDGSDKAQLTESPLDPEVSVPQQRYPQWSPDSTTLAYTEVQAKEFGTWTESEVCTVAISGGSLSCLTDAPGVDADGHYRRTVSTSSSSVTVTGTRRSTSWTPTDRTSRR